MKTKLYGVFYKKGKKWIGPYGGEFWTESQIQRAMEWCRVSTKCRVEAREMKISWIPAEM